MRVKRTAFKRKGRRGGRRSFKRGSIVVKKRPYSRLRVSRWKPALGNFPPSKTVAVRYVETININAGTSAAVQVFRANSVYDPNYTGSGHQPMYHDNYAAVYGKYRVNHSTITMVGLDTHITNNVTSTVVAGTTTSTTENYAANERAVRMFIIRDQTAGAADYNANLDTLIEEGNTNLVWRYCPQTTSAKMPILRFSCYPHRLLQNNPKEEDNASLVNNVPTNNCYYICGVADLDSGNADPKAMNFQFIITYNVTYYDLQKNQTQN